MREHAIASATLILAGLSSWGCAGSDNPQALSELEPITVFEIEAGSIETFDEVEIHVRVSDGGDLLSLQHAEMEVEPASGGPIRTTEMEPENDGYSAHITFFEPGEHHLHFTGTPEGHRLSAEMGEHEVDVVRRHAVVGPYWVELEIDPAPAFENSSAHLELFVYEIRTDGMPGSAVEGLSIEAEVHDPGGAVSPVEVTEAEGGEYEAEHTFGRAGIYELHVAIDTGGEESDGEFDFPVLSRQDDSNSDPDQGGDHGH